MSCKYTSFFSPPQLVSCFYVYLHFYRGVLGLALCQFVQIVVHSVILARNFMSQEQLLIYVASVSTEIEP